MFVPAALRNGDRAVERPMSDLNLTAPDELVASLCPVPHEEAGEQRDTDTNCAFGCLLQTVTNNIKGFP